MTKVLNMHNFIIQIIDARLNDSLVKKMSEEEQIRYALQISSKQVGIVHPKPDMAASSTKTSLDLSHNKNENKIKHSR